MNWIQAQSPALTGDRYGATTPPLFYPGGFHYHTGLAVAGMPETAQPERVGRKLTAVEATVMRDAMVAQKISQGTIAELISRPIGSIGRYLRQKGYLPTSDIARWQRILGI